MKHKTAPYLLTPLHPVMVTLIGTGGTGSHMLFNLGRIHAALKLLGHPGLYVVAFDDDEVTSFNIGRQFFSPANIGHKKAEELVTMNNRYWGTQWDGYSVKYNARTGGNIIITCTDTISSRKKVWEKLYKSKVGGKKNTFSSVNKDMQKNYYWLDIGNSADSGQVILGSNQKDNSLKCVFEVFPELLQRADKKDEPSCSMADALQRQDLFINSILAHYGAQMLWSLFRNLGLKEDHGVFVNLQSLLAAPLKI